MTEQDEVERLFQLFEKESLQVFPKSREQLQATKNQAVYIIQDNNGAIVQVGRTCRGKNGLHGRLMDHLSNRSSFSKKYIKKKGFNLRDGFTFQYLEVPDDRHRALLEHFLTARYCPKHLGLNSNEKE